jgi:hypothetical protein
MLHGQNRDYWMQKSRGSVKSLPLSLLTGAARPLSDSPESANDYWLEGDRDRSGL